MGYVARSPRDIEILSDVEKKEMTYRAATDEEIKKFESFQEEMGLEFQHNSLKTHRHKKQYA